jgi:uncharacterized membrane protein (DUF106 family)
MTVPRKKKSPWSTALLFVSFGLVILILFNEPLRQSTGNAAGFVLGPLIGFGYVYPLLTIFLASLVLVIATTAIRHFMVDWVQMARVQEAMRSFQKEFMQARKDNNTYKIKKLTDAQPEVMQLQAEMSTEQMKPMALTMLLVVPIFAWLAHLFFMPEEGSGASPGIFLANARDVVKVPWDAHWELWMATTSDSSKWYLLGFLPRWIVLYSLFGIPLGQLAQKVLKLYEYRNVDLDGDGVPAGRSE